MPVLSQSLAHSSWHKQCLSLSISWLCFYLFGALLILKVCLLVSKPELLAWPEPWQCTLGNCHSLLHRCFSVGSKATWNKTGQDWVPQGATSKAKEQTIWCCKISTPLVGSIPECLRTPFNVSSFQPMNRDLPKKQWQGFPESGTCHYQLTRIKQLISLSQTRKCSLFFWSFREEAIMSFSGDAVKPWIFGQKADCSVLTVTHLHQPILFV